MTPRPTTTTYGTRPTETMANHARRFRSYAGAATNVGAWMPANWV